jgi:23S rRNA pseudouridine1911/1915/1917 synthase
MRDSKRKRGESIGGVPLAEKDGAPDDDPQHAATVPDELDGLRLDAACAQLIPAYSRARIQRWIDQGRVRVNGAVAARARDPVRAQDRIELHAEADDAPGTVQAQKIALDLVHADTDLAIVNKPAGLTVHPGAGQKSGTLQNALLHRFPQTAAVPRAGIVHRLDKDTSGLLVVALTLKAHAALVRAMARREVRREYDAVVQGTFVAGGTIDLPMGRHPRDRLKQAVLERGGRPAVTHFRVQERFARHAHLRVTLETGRTHQIRVHFSHQRHPIIGDVLYGGHRPRGAGMSVELRELLQAFPRQALHARELELIHPLSGRTLRFAAEPPADMQSLLAALRRLDPP